MSKVQFGSLFEFIRNGMNVKQDKSGDGLPISRIETIWNSSVDPQRVGYAGLGVDDCNGWLLSPGDILFSHINSVDHIGKCAVYEGVPDKLIHGMNLLCLRSKPGLLLPSYAKHMIRSKDFRARLSSYINKSVNQASISIGKLKSIEVTVPTVTEQRRVAAILDKADAVRTKRREALAQTDRLAQSIFVDMFGDPAKNPKGWPILTLKELGKISTGGTPPSTREGMFGGDIPFITPGDLESGLPAKRMVTEAGAREAGTVRAGATLVCCIGTIGKMSTALVRSSFNQQLNAVEWFEERIDDHYGLAALRFFKPTIVAWGASTTIPILKKSSFEKLSIPAPPIAMQRVFAERVRAVSRLEVKLRCALNREVELSTSLRSRAFEGGL